MLCFGTLPQSRGVSSPARRRPKKSLARACIGIFSRASREVFSAIVSGLGTAMRINVKRWRARPYQLLFQRAWWCQQRVGGGVRLISIKEQRICLFFLSKSFARNLQACAYLSGDRRSSATATPSPSKGGMPKAPTAFEVWC